MKIGNSSLTRGSKRKDTEFAFTNARNVRGSWQEMRILNSKMGRFEPLLLLPQTDLSAGAHVASADLTHVLIRDDMLGCQETQVEFA